MRPPADPPARTGEAPDGAPPGPLAGLRVVELAGEWTAFAGKLLGDLGAEVTLVEPPGGSPCRWTGPFAGDEPHPERSLWWWHYQTSKRGVTADLDTPAGRAAFLALVEAADIVLEGEPPGRLADLAIDHPEVRADRPELLWVSVTTFGRASPRSLEPATDLTLLAGGGPVWSCGYDDHSLPPVRGGGYQSLHTAGLHAVMATLAAVLHRQAGGPGQHIDVSIHAAANVTTEAATYHWLVAGETVQRQTCRHASHVRTAETASLDVDGRWLNTGVPPRDAAGYVRLYEWLAELGLLEALPEAFLLRLGAERGGTPLIETLEPGEAREIFGAARDAMRLIASTLPDRRYFVEGQRRGLAVGVIYAPEEVMDDPHFVERGFRAEVFQDEIGRTVTHLGAPLQFGRSPWRIRRAAPRLAEERDVP